MNEVSPIKLCLDQCGVEKFGISKADRPQSSDAVEIGVNKQCGTEIGASQVCLAQIRFAEAGAQEKCRGEVGLLQISFAEVCAATALELLQPRKSPPSSAPPRLILANGFGLCPPDVAIDRTSQVFSSTSAWFAKSRAKRS
jgi:hypothetical protein